MRLFSASATIKMSRASEGQTGASQGFKTGTPTPAGSLTLRVTRVSSCSKAVAAINRQFDDPSHSLALPSPSSHPFCNPSVTGRMRPANHGRRTASSQSYNCSLFPLFGSFAMPLQISAREMTLKKSRSFSASFSQRSTRGSDRRRVSSEGTFVSRRKPFTVRPEAGCPGIAQNPRPDP